jgi:hypothetical protein
MSQFFPIPASATAALVTILILKEYGTPEVLAFGVALCVALFVGAGWIWSDSLPNGGGV